MTEHEKFLEDHGIRLVDNFTSYHYSYALYVWYMIESMQMAEDIEDGLYFDELEAALLLEGLAGAYGAMKHFRGSMQETYAEFDVAETVAMKGCRLEAGKLKGSDEAAEKTARMWIRDYEKQKGKLFCFEVGVYILFLLRKEVDYRFLARRKGSAKNVYHGQGSEAAGLGIQPEKVPAV